MHHYHSLPMCSETLKLPTSYDGSNSLHLSMTFCCGQYIQGKYRRICGYSHAARPQHQRRRVGASHHRLKAGFDLKQPMPANLSIDCRKRIFIGIIRGLQGDDRVEEQPTHQLDEYHHRIVGDLLAELDDLRRSRRAPTAGIEVASESGWRSIALANHPVPSPRRNAGL